MSKHINTDILRQLAEDTSEFNITAIIERFSKEMNTRQLLIHQHIAKFDFSKVAFQAHAIKSIASSFGANSLLESANSLEQEIVKESYYRIFDKICELDKAVTSSIDELNSYTSDNHPCPLKE